MENRKIAIIINPMSGNRKGKSLGKGLQDYLQQAQAGLPYEVFETEYSGHATSLANQASKDSYTDLIVIGGDGTFNEAINGLYGESMTTALIPAGTGNDFLKTLPWPNDLKKQFESAVNGPIRKIDVGTCNQRRFVNTMGLGFDGQVVDTMETYGKQFNGSLAYLYATVKEFFAYREPTANISWDGKTEELPLFMMAINNGKWFGGGMLITPDAVMDDGLFDVCLVTKLSILERLLHLPKAVKGKHTNLDMVKMFKTNEIKIESEQQIIAQADGEYLGTPPFHITLAPKALSVRVDIDSV